ncbi:MAG: VCBS repeat-containing protein, partial [Chloroflexota bacterium]
DLDNDGDKELIAPTDTHYITGLDHDGNQLAASNIYGEDEVWSEVGVHVDHDVDLRGYANCGTEHRPNFANMGPAISDLDGNGSLEIIVPGDVYDCAIGDNAEGDLYIMPWILNLDRTRWANSSFDWEVLPSPAPNSRPLSEDYSVIENNVTNMVAADLDGDGVKELIYTAYDGRLHAYWLDKTQHGNWPFTVPGSGIRFAAEPVIVDIDNDGKAEVIFTSWPEKSGNRIGHLHVLDYLGNELYRLELPSPRSGNWNGGLAAPSLGNIDDDEDLEVVIGTFSSGVVAYDLPGSANARVLWGTGRGSYERTGYAPDLNEFYLSIPISTVTIKAGESATFDIEITADANFEGDITLQASIQESGFNVQLSQSTVTPNGTVTLTVEDQRTTLDATPLWVEISLKATGMGMTKEQQLGVLINGQGIFLPFMQSQND